MMLITWLDCGAKPRHQCAPDRLRSGGIFFDFEPDIYNFGGQMFNFGAKMLHI
jgi:hypothetical protein